MKNFLLILLIFTLSVSAQPKVDLEYIFGGKPIINPRPSVKAVNSEYTKLYYYADDDFDHMLDLFEYNYSTGLTAEVSDSTNSFSEFILLDNGDLVTILHGDIYISKNFAQYSNFTEDIAYTNTNEYEYDIRTYGNMLTFRRSGDYFIKLIDKPELQESELTNDESDIISNQILSMSGSGSVYYSVFARYDNSNKQKFNIPNYTTEFATNNIIKKGVSNAEYFIVRTVPSEGKLLSSRTKIDLPGNQRWYVHSTAFSPDNSSVLFDAESLDRRTRKLFLYDILGNNSEEIYSEYYSAGWLERHGNTASFLNSNELIFDSEISGYNTLYKIDLSSHKVTPLVKGEFTVNESLLDRKNQKIYFTANPGEPSSWNIYVSDYDGNYSQLSSGDAGYEELNISPDGAVLFFSFSRTNIPDELYSLDTRSRIEKQVTNTIAPAFADVEWIIPELISFNNIEDNENIYAHLFKPPDFNAKKKYPLIIFAHGSGYVQNVSKGFAVYRDNFMVHTFFAQQGFLVLDIDYRGSAGYGADFRNKTWRNLGRWEVSDLISAVKHLESLGFIDRNKVGVYGGSYGGFLTLMSVFNEPDYFRAGAALKPVSDWENYFYSNPWFTHGRLGDPENDEDKEMYRMSSPVTYAEYLRVPLLIMHGMLDDNVFFQQSVKLVQKLIDNKKDFEVMYYPKEYHSFHQQASWLDEYKRIFNFFTKYILKK